ncbi:MAG: hypothetical protein ACLS85_02070 [Coprobacillus cateniformis]
MKSFLNHLFMTKNLKKKVTKKVKVNKYQKKLLPKMLKRLKKVERKEEPEIKKNYEMMDIISPIFGMHEEKKK